MTTRAEPAPRAESAPRVLRADAERNRELILRTATRLFAERGIEVTLNDIAHEAGLGVGTVYRRFPDKQSLVTALADDKLQRIRDGMQETLAHCSVRDAFRSLMLGAAEARAADRGLFKVVFQSGDTSPEGHRRVTELLHVWAKLVDQAKEAGAVREGFSPSDVDLFMLMVGTVADATRDIDPQAWRRCAEVLLDGFAPRADDAVLAPLELDDEGRRRIFLS